MPKKEMRLLGNIFIYLVAFKINGAQENNTETKLIPYEFNRIKDCEAVKTNEKASEICCLHDIFFKSSSEKNKKKKENKQNNEDEEELEFLWPVEQYDYFTVKNEKNEFYIEWRKNNTDGVNLYEEVDQLFYLFKTDTILSLSFELKLNPDYVKRRKSKVSHIKCERANKHIICGFCATLSLLLYRFRHMALDKNAHEKQMSSKKFVHDVKLFLNFWMLNKTRYPHAELKTILEKTETLTKTYVAAIRAFIDKFNSLYTKNTAYNIQTNTIKKQNNINTQSDNNYKKRFNQEVEKKQAKLANTSTNTTECSSKSTAGRVWRFLKLIAKSVVAAICCSFVWIILKKFR